MERAGRGEEEKQADEVYLWPSLITRMKRRDDELEPFWSFILHMCQKTIVRRRNDLYVSVFTPYFSTEEQKLQKEEKMSSAGTFILKELL